MKKLTEEEKYSKENITSRNWLGEGEIKSPDVSEHMISIFEKMKEYSDFKQLQSEYFTLQALLFKFREELSEELLKKYDEHFHITTDRHGRI